MTVDQNPESGEKPMQLVSRALAVLLEIADHRQGLTLQQLHKNLAIPLASTHRIAGTLEMEGFLLRSNATKRYTLGEKAHRLGRQQDYRPHIVPVPVALKNLAAASGETVFLTELIDNRVICISLVESMHNLRLFVQVGQEMPLHAAASARTILAYRDPGLVEALLSSAAKEGFTPATPRAVNEVIDRLAEVRRSGFDVCSNELDDDVWAVAAPVFNHLGQVNFAVTMAAAIRRMSTPERRAAATAAVIEAATLLSREQGYEGEIVVAATVEQLTARYARESQEHPFSLGDAR